MTQVPNSGPCSLCLRFVFLTWTSFLPIAFSGCEEVQKAVNDAKSEVSGSPSPSTTPAVPTNAVPESMSPAAPSPAPVVGPTPAEIIARFQALQPSEITDGDLTLLASTSGTESTVSQINLTGNRHVTSSGLAQLATLKTLTSLNLVSSGLSPADLSLVGNVHSLNELILSATQADDTVINSLAAIPHLQVLDLSGTPITAAAGAGLSKMQELRELKLVDTATDDQFIGLITSLPLQTLRLGRTRVTGAAVPELLRMKSLEVLGVEYNGIPGIAWKGASKANLTELSVAETPFGLEGLDAIKGMDSLEILNIYNTGLVEHKAANVFRSFPKLRVLNAGGNAVSDAGVEVFFKGLKNLEELYLGGNKYITDQGLASLTGLKKLQLLDLNNTNCGQAGALALKKKLPDCKIRVNNMEY
jgi:Leucine-rich repeat (LRR) protein